VIFLGDFSFVRIFLKNYRVTMTTTSCSENTMILSARRGFLHACIFYSIVPIKTLTCSLPNYLCIRLWLLGEIQFDCGWLYTLVLIRENVFQIEIKTYLSIVLNTYICRYSNVKVFSWVFISQDDHLCI
jgi:hypothetical protein